jgi:hypothetical protein
MAFALQILAMTLPYVVIAALLPAHTAHTVRPRATTSWVCLPIATTDEVWAHR